MTAAPPVPPPEDDVRVSGRTAALAIARRDLLEFVRDRRTLFVTLLLPMVTYPIVALSSALGVRTAVTDLEARNQPAPLVVAMSGADAGALALRIETAVERGRPAGATMAWPSKASFLHGAPAEAIEAVEAGGADVWIDAPAGLVAALDGAATVEIDVRYPSRRPGNGRSREQFEAVMRAVAEDARVRRVSAAGLAQEILHPLRLHVVGESPAAPAVSSETLLPALTAAVLVLLAVLTMTGAFYPAIDAIAGEKERGTIETLLMAPCSTEAIVFGKFLAVWVVALATLAANCLSIAATAAVGMRFLPAGALASVPAPALGAAVTVVAFTGLAAVAAATCLAVTTASRSGKEAQNTLTPVILLVAALAGSALLPGSRADGALALVPFAGQVMLARDVLSDREPPDALGVLPPLLLSLLSAFVCTWVLLRLTAWLLTDEEVLFRGSDEGGTGLLRRPAPRTLPTPLQGVAPILAGVAGLWYVQALAPDDLFLAIPVQQALAVVLPLVLMLAWQRVDLRETLAVRRPGAGAAGIAVTAGGAALGAGAYLVSAALLLSLRGTELSAEVRSLSERIVTLVAERPWWVSVALVALLPAIAEETLFRGWALGALAGERPSRLRAAAAVVLQAALFAVAHVLPERMPATFLLGLVAGTLRMATGSLLPAIACHAMHNALPIVLLLLHLRASPGDAGALRDLATGTASGLPAALVPLALGLLAAGITLVGWGTRRRPRTAAALLLLLVPLPAGATAAEPVRVGVANVGVTLDVVDGRPTGASAVLWEDLATRLGAETVYVPLPSIAAGLEAAATGAIDLFLGPVPITRERESMLDFTHPVVHSGLRIAVRDEGTDSWLGPMDILLSREALRLLLVLLALTVLVGHLLWWCERRANDRSFPRDWRRGTWEGTWWGISTLVTGGCDDKHVDTVAGRVLATAWMTVGVCLVAMFTGSLAATLTEQRINGEIHGPRDLPGREIGAQRTGAAGPAIRSRGGIPVEFPTLDEAFAAADEGTVEAVVAEQLTLKHAIARPGRGAYRLVGPVFDSFDAGIALRPGSPLREPLNAAILQMREDGAIDSIIDRWLGGRE